MVLKDNRKRQGTLAFPAKTKASLPRKVTGNNSLTSVRKGYCYLQKKQINVSFQHPQVGTGDLHHQIFVPANKKTIPAPAKSKSTKLTTFSSSPLLSKGFGFLNTLISKHETVFGISFLSIFKQHFNHFLEFCPTMRFVRVLIINISNQGVTLDSSFDIDISAVESKLNTAKIGRPLKVLPQIDSTSEEIRRNPKLPEGAVIIADLQTHGRGRQGRSWHSEPGTGLYLSTLLKPKIPPENLSLLSLMAGVATASSIQQQAEVEVKLKWPNDILLNGKKLAGILCECIATTPPSIIVGIGINLKQSTFPTELQGLATSIKLETGNIINRTDLVLSLIHNIDKEYEEFLQAKRTHLVEKWTEKTDMFGKTITVFKKGNSLTGTAKRLDQIGRLILQTSDGKQHTLDSGEVSFNPPVSPQ